MGNQWQKTPNNKKFEDSFLEVLRDLGVRNVAESPSTKTKTDTISKSGVLRAGEATRINESNQEAKKYRQLFFQERGLRFEERSLKVREEQETKLKVQQLHQELTKYSETQTQLSQQVKLAIIQTETPTIGTYHISFLEHLIGLVKLLRKNVEQASNWLAVFNQRSKKKNYYWGQVKKSGSKFYLSPDRYSATQAG